MPIFEYHCNECNAKFELLTSDKNNQQVNCPECNSTQTKKLFSAFSTSTSSSYPANSCASGNCDIDTSNLGGCANGMCGLN
ncbi:MAG: zinc ribbon domain-containing protein [Ignavibacteria bacterium]|jgi:putative FmdB family regulatory protein